MRRFEGPSYETPKSQSVAKIALFTQWHRGWFLVGANDIETGSLTPNTSKIWSVCGNVILGFYLGSLPFALLLRLSTRQLKGGEVIFGLQF